MNESFFKTGQWQTAKKRYNAFWSGTGLDKGLFSLNSQPQIVEENISPETKWLDIDRRVSEARKHFENTKFYVDGFPSYFVNFGPGVLASCIGGDFVLADDTIWFDRHPMLKDWKDADKVKFYNNSPMWDYIKRLTDGCAKYGNMICSSITDIGGTLDIVASLRGSETLLYDLFDYPEEILSLIEQIEPIWERTFTYFADLLADKQEGYTSWMPIWCHDRYYPLQCDFSAMISPNMFAEFALPNLKRQTEFLDHSIYHLDGPKEIAHLDHILSLSRLDAIQWVPGAGAPDMWDPCWFDMYEKIFSAGKGLVFLQIPPEHVEYMMKNLKGNRYFIHTDCYDSKQAEELEQFHSLL